MIRSDVVVSVIASLAVGVSAVCSVIAQADWVQIGERLGVPFACFLVFSYGAGRILSALTNRHMSFIDFLQSNHASVSDNLAKQTVLLERIAGTQDRIVSIQESRDDRLEKLIRGMGGE